MSEKQFEDELVRIEAESAEALRKGFKNGKLMLQKNVVLLSKAKKVMDEFVAEMTEYGGYDGKEGNRYLYSYKNGQKFKRPVNE